MCAILVARGRWHSKAVNERVQASATWVRVCSARNSLIDARTWFHQSMPESWPTAPTSHEQVQTIILPARNSWFEVP